MTNITIALYRDWIDTVKEVFRGSGRPLPVQISDGDAALAYFLQTAASEDEAGRLRDENEERLARYERIILDNFETVILPDIRSRTGYEGDRFSFKWVYNMGEHIIEEHSSYRIPL
ncbi:hypothetical protein [Paenibacillus arenilitoris]|uniref:Uncharacterized protein n=1 Tax=Paenibacillus arenilitoris TaxID=2772299 RepID=A0A927CVX4_9BACL|nr:hypothetical protein [Paenibacillus arenilitoris]MBD2872515.1 hypothetical protein [Paenibacillus arenilitoris]